MKFTNKLLSEVVFFQEGPGVRKFQFRNEGVKLLNVGNINKGVLDTSTTKLYISEEEAYGKYKHFLVDEGDLLIASSGIVVDNFHNKIAYVKKEHLPLCLNTSTIRFKTLDENVFNLDYLKFYLKTTHFKNQLRKLITGAAQLNFGPSHLKKITLPVPPLPDQLHIATILSKAENLIAQRKESIRLLDEFLKSTFLEMFGDPIANKKKWEVLALSDVCSKITDGTHDTPERLTQGVKYITGKHITPFNIDFENSDYVTEEVHQGIYRRTNVEFDDILYTNIGANVGTAARVKVKYEFSLKNVALLKQDRAKLRSHYIEHLLNLSNFKNRLLSLLSIGGAQKFLNLKSIGKIKIPVPPIALQTQFTHIVEKTEALKTQYKQSLQELENLYGSLSQKAFRGELSVK